MQQVRICGGIEVGEGQILAGVGNVGSVSGLVLPSLEVHGFCRADAEQDAQNFEVAHLLSQSGVEAGTTYFDEPKVEASSVGDGLQVVGDGTARTQIVLVGDSWVLPFGQIGNGIREAVAERSGFPVPLR